ncbi:MAG: ferrous iron transport protein A [Aristaeellaceae bacterium]
MDRKQPAAHRDNVAQLQPGEWGIVDKVGGEGALHRHLLDMGITPGVHVTLRKTAPMGDPLEIHVRGYSLTLRKDDAAQITLRQEAEQA